MWLKNFLASAALWGLLGAIPAVMAEYLYRTLQGSWISHLYLGVPLQLSIGYCIFKLVTMPNTSLMGAFAIWSFSTIALRVFVSVALLHDDVKPGVWFALGLVIMARIAQNYWR